MARVNQSLKRLLFTLDQLLDSENRQWTPLVPQECQEECFSLRSDMIGWIRSINKMFGFCDETFFLAVQIFDRFLLQIKAQTRYLRCIGITCLYLAAKINEEEENVPGTRELIETCEYGFSEHEIRRMELCILDKLKWNLLSHPTPIQFLHVFDALIRLKCPSLNRLSPDNAADGNDIMTTALARCMAHRDLLLHKPSVVALSVLSLYLRLTWMYWKPAVQTLQDHTRIQDEKLSRCSSLVEGFVGGYIRDAVVCSSRVVIQQNLNNNNNADNVESESASQEEEMMGSLSVSNKTPLSTPVSPDPPAKRRRVEMDEDVYSDIRTLYEPPDVELTRKFVSRFREVTPLMSYAAVVRSTCASEALQLGGAALGLSLQRVAST